MKVARHEVPGNGRSIGPVPQGTTEILSPEGATYRSPALQRWVGEKENEAL